MRGSRVARPALFLSLLAMLAFVACGGGEKNASSMASSESSAESATAPAESGASTAPSGEAGSMEKQPSQGMPSGEMAGSAESGSSAAAGASESASSGNASQGLTMPDWMHVDHSAKTVTLDITAAKTDANHSWNFNGYANGDATIVVPEGYHVTIHFHNADTVSPHSIGVDERTGNFPSVFENPKPAFSGAITPDAANMAKAVQPGQDATLNFTASKAGQYALNCYVPAHAAAGMWIGFDVSAKGEAGLRTKGSS